MIRHSALLAVLLTAGWNTPPVQTNEVTFENATGMAVIFLHVAGCDESEGSDWDDMMSWAEDRLGDDFMMPGDSVSIELFDGCYVIQPTYEDGTQIMEQVQVEGDTQVVLTLG